MGIKYIPIYIQSLHSLSPNVDNNRPIDEQGKKVINTEKNNNKA